MHVLVTGGAGFIGSNLVKALYKKYPEGLQVVVIDNMNDYYDVRLKEARVKELSEFPDFTFVKGNIADKELGQPVVPAIPAAACGESGSSGRSTLQHYQSGIGVSRLLRSQ